MTAILLLIKVSLLLGAALVAARLLRRAPALSRHGMWSVAFAGVLMLPLLDATLPALAIPISLPAPLETRPAVTSAPVAAETKPVAAETKLEVAPVEEAGGGHVDMTPASVPAATGKPLRLASLIAGVWAAGAALALAALLISLARVRRLAHGAAALDDEVWVKDVRDIAGRLGMQRAPRVLTSASVATPMAGGFVRPTIFVPASAREWSAECRAIVLAHEIAHLSRRDPLRQLLARLAVAVYWFHPLAWLAAREATAAREQACDEAVIALGTRPSTYARVLMAFADAMPSGTAPLAALPIVQRTLLETRLMAILNGDARPRTRRLALVPVLFVALFTVSVAAVHIETTVIEPARVENVNIQTAAPMVRAAQKQTSACEPLWTGSFSGSSSTSRRSDGSVAVYDMVGSRNGDLVFIKHFGDLRVCALFAGLSEDQRGDARNWTRAGRVLLETARGNETRRMEMASERNIVSWQVNGAARPADAAAQEWADRLIALLAPAWQLSALHGQVSSLRGQISSIEGQRSSLQGQISSIQGEVSSLQGRISALRGQESSLRGRISSLQGHVSSLQGAMSSAQGAISSLRASRWDSEAARRGDIDERIREHEKTITRIEAEIRAFDAPGKIAEVEREIVRLRIDDKVAEVDVSARSGEAERRIVDVQRRIEQLGVEKKIVAIERDIEALNVDRRSRDLEAQMEAALTRLQETLARIR